jgi:hypothetical protein
MKSHTTYRDRRIEVKVNGRFLSLFAGRFWRRHDFGPGTSCGPNENNEPGQSDGTSPYYQAIDYYRGWSVTVRYGLLWRPRLWKHNTWLSINRNAGAVVYHLRNQTGQPQSATRK